MNKLKVCPFCGSSNLDVRGSLRGPLYIYCEDCESKGPTALSQDYAEELWNERVCDKKKDNNNANNNKI